MDGSPRMIRTSYPIPIRIAESRLQNLSLPSPCLLSIRAATRPCLSTFVKNWESSAHAYPCCACYTSCFTNCKIQRDHAYNIGKCRKSLAKVMDSRILYQFGGKALCYSERRFSISRWSQSPRVKTHWRPRGSHASPVHLLEMRPVQSSPRRLSRKPNQMPRMQHTDPGRTDH